MEESDLTKVTDHERSDLPARAKVALRFADCILGWPRSVPLELREELHSHFTEEEIVDVALQVLKWSNQKIRVALGIDALGHEDITSFEIDDHGTPVIGHRRPEC